MTRRQNTKSDSYEALLWDVVTNVHNYVPHPGAQVLDLGAHFGMFSLYCASRGCDVVAYEPSADAFDELEHSARTAAAIGRGSIRPYQLAIADQDGVAPWYTHPETTGGNRICREITGLVVRCATLKTALEDREWDCVKVDIEGSEYAVFKSATAEDLAKINYLTVEIHNDLLTPEQCQELRTVLVRSFYRVRRLPVLVNGEPTQQDSALFCWRHSDLFWRHHHYV